jgi:hypothetical protein
MVYISANELPESDQPREVVSAVHALLPLDTRGRANTHTWVGTLLLEKLCPSETTTSVYHTVSQL